MIVGMADNVMKAETKARSEPYCPWNCMVPSGKVQNASLFKTTRGMRKSFQLTIMVNAATADNAGRASGRRMRQKKSNVVQPSIYAASCNSAGIAVKKPRKIMMLPDNWKAVCTTMTPQRLSIKSNWRNTKYTGRMAMLIGNISPKVNRLNANPFVRNSMRANTKAARLQITTTAIVTTNITNRLLRNNSQNMGVAKMPVMFSQRGGIG